MKHVKFFIPILFVFVLGCSHSSKREEGTLFSVHDKRVTLTEVKGDVSFESKKIVEVTLINSLIETGYFVIVSRTEKNPDADYALTVNVDEWKADISEGYDDAAIEDSQLEEDRGKGKGKSKATFKVKRMQAAVTFDLNYTPLKENLTKVATKAHAEKTVESSAQKEAIHLPAKLSLLQSLSNEAFLKLFSEK